MQPTTPQARIGRIKNYFFIYRIDAAEQLYKAGKIEKILIYWCPLKLYFSRVRICVHERSENSGLIPLRIQPF